MIFKRKKIYFKAAFQTSTHCLISKDKNQNLPNNLCLIILIPDMILERKTFTNLDSVLKNIDITLLTKVRIVKTIVFPVVMYGCWTIKKVECQRIGAFELWCWRRFLRVPCTSGRSNQSILKEITPEYSLDD